MNDNLLSIGKIAKILGISIKTLQRWDKAGKLNALRIGGKSNRYYRKADIDLLIKDQLAVVKNWATNQIGYEPEPEHFCKTRDIFQARLESFQVILSKNTELNLTSLITAIVGEIGNNSFDHNIGNWPDILGVYFTYTLSERRIVLADRGLGILTTLKRTLPYLKDHKEALEIAFTETVSGRAPESRGNGLKFVRNVVVKNPIKLFFQTGNAFLNLSGKNSNIKIEVSNEPMRGCIAVVEY